MLLSAIVGFRPWGMCSKGLPKATPLRIIQQRQWRARRGIASTSLESQQKVNYIPAEDLKYTLTHRSFSPQL